MLHVASPMLHTRASPAFLFCMHCMPGMLQRAQQLLLCANPHPLARRQHSLPRLLTAAHHSSARLLLHCPAGRPAAASWLPTALPHCAVRLSPLTHALQAEVGFILAPTPILVIAVPAHSNLLT